MSPTPILDRQQPAPAPPKPHRKRSLAIGGAIGVAIVCLSYAFPERSQLAPSWFFLAFLAALLAGVLLHELGHVVAGLAVGFEFRRLLAGPWMLTRESRGFRLRFLWKRVLVPSGFTAMVPRSADGLRRRFAWFAAGGALATLLLFLPIALLGWGPLAFALLAANATLAASSWIPMETSGIYTDGKIILTLSRRGPEGDRLAAVLYIMAIDGRGVQPKEWPAHVLTQLALPGGGRAFRAAGCVLIQIHARDVAAPEGVADALERVLGLGGELRADLRRSYFAEAAFWQGVHKRNGALARAWLEDARAVKGAVVQKDWDAAALAAIALAEGNQPEFRDHLGRALGYLDRQPGPSGSVAAARARLLRLSEEAATV